MFERNRRLRTTASLRKMFTETTVHPEQLVKPLFVHPEKKDTPLPKLPDSAVLSISSLLKEVESLLKLGILGINLYPSLKREQKDAAGTEALNPKGIIPKAIDAIKKNFPECVVIPDVALDPYTAHGHDGLIDASGKILNDESIALLGKQAALYAESGADIIAPSDMFDGRTAAIRKSLDTAGFIETPILAYSSKYASAFYSPFRSALGNDHLQKIDKLSYQLDPSNARTAIQEIETDLAEGADILMIKPGILCLDIIRTARNMTDKPIAAFHISGECAVIKCAAEAGLLDETAAVREQLLAMRRAGADLIFTYYAKRLFV